MKDDLFENEPTVLSYKRAKAIPPKVMDTFRRIINNNKNQNKGKDKNGKTEN